MAWFFGLGITGVVLLALSLVFDGVLDGAFDGVSDGVLDGVLHGGLSLPVVAGFVATTGFGGVLGAGAAWLTYRFGPALMRDQSAVTHGAMTWWVLRGGGNGKVGIGE